MAQLRDALPCAVPRGTRDITGSEVGTQFIQDLAVVLLVAGVVGVVCQRLNLSVVVGFLFAGVLIGPYTPPFQLVADLDRVQMLADVGLVFLIFSIGLDLNLKRLQRLGFSVAFATFLSAMLLLNLGRFVGLALGWSGTASLFLAAVIMVSSSAIISKILQELDQVHERSGQLALGITVLEDTVAIIMLTLLTSMLRVGDASLGQILPTIGGLSAFVLALFLTALVLVPRLLRFLDMAASPEVRNLVVIGLVLSLSWLAVTVGYSLALGAFVLGAIIGSTKQRRDIDRALEGLRQIFGAVFFVAMGMLLDVQLLLKALPLIVILSVVAIGARILSSTLGLLAVGTSLRHSLKAGLTLTPIGEFSFIIAQLGVAEGVVEPAFYPAAVGLSLVTAIAGPVLTRHSNTIATKIEARTPALVRDWLRAYHDAFIVRLARPQGSARSREALRHLVPAGLQIASATALLLFLEPLYTYAAERLGDDFLSPMGLRVLSGVVLGLILLAPMFAAWRHLCAFGNLVIARNVRSDGHSTRPGAALLTTAMRMIIASSLGAWFLALLPFGFSVTWSLLLVLGAVAGVGIVLWRPLSRWHTEFESGVREQLYDAQSPPSALGLARALRERPADWDMRLEEVELPSAAGYAGQSIGALAIRPRFGCSVVGIERHGFVIFNPSRDEVLYPGDRILLLGTADQIDEAEKFFLAAGVEPRGEGFDGLTFEAHMIPEGGAITEASLLELDIIRRFGVQVGGLRRGAQWITSTNGSTVVRPGDELLLVGTPVAIREFLAWVSTPTAAAGPTLAADAAATP